MKKLLLILLLFDSLGSFAQDLTGTWEGVLFTDRSNGRRRKFYFRLYLKQQGSLVWGVCEGLSAVQTDNKFEINKAKLSCKYPMSGELPRNIDGPKHLALFRGNVTEANIPLGICESVFHFDFTHKLVNKAEFLAGKWYSIYSETPRTDGAGGDIILGRASYESPDFVDEFYPKLDKMRDKYFKKDSAYLVKIGVYEKIFTSQVDNVVVFDSLIYDESNLTDSIQEIQSDRREDIVQKIIDIDSLFIKIDLYDNGIVDDDTVSVFLNGAKIVSSRRLTANPLHMELELDDKDENELKLFADNLGEIPPNTALMIVTCGNKRIEVNLSASLGNNAVVIFRKMKKVP
jgi:hypothetical protein